MFRRISASIAIRFTVFVFLLMIANGVIFLAADYENARREAHGRLERSLQFVVQQAEDLPAIPPQDMPPFLRERIRIVDALGRPLYVGGVFADVPFDPRLGYSEVHLDDEEFHVLTAPVINKGNILGYAQIADIERTPISGLPLRAAIYLMVSAVVSMLTYIVGVAFARKSLAPAQQMMERLEQFTQDASHELRTPIAALSSSLDLALKTHKYREGIVSAKEDLRDVSSLTERLLELARLDKLALDLHSIDMSGLTEDAIERHRPLALEKGMTIESHVAANIRVKGDAALIRQVIGNLIANAIKFNTKGGMVRVVLSRSTLSIEDDGIGIEAASLPHIFDRFYQADTSRAKDGFGLGLAFVKRVVDIHGWSITAHSKEGKGTTFVVRFS